MVPSLSTTRSPGVVNADGTACILVHKLLVNGQNTSLVSDGREWLETVHAILVEMMECRSRSLFSSQQASGDTHF